jgi:hypothetical protein
MRRSAGIHFSLVKWRVGKYKTTTPNQYENQNNCLFRAGCVRAGGLCHGEPSQADGWGENQ